MAFGFVAAITLAACGGGGGSSVEEFCDIAEQANDAGDDVDVALDSGDPGDIEDAMADALDEYQLAIDAAPEEIQEDVEILGDAQNELFDILEANDFDLVAAIDDPDFTDLIEDKDIEDASDNLDDYLLDECGIEPDEETDDTASADTVADTVADTAADETIVEETVVEETVVAETVVETTAVAQDLSLTAEVGGTTVGDESSPTGIYAALLTNDTGLAASNLSIDFTMLDEAGTVVGTGSAYVDLILPGQTRAVSGSVNLTAPAARIEASYSGDTGLPYGIEEGDLPAGAFGIEGTQLITDEYSTGILGLLTSSYPVGFDSVEVTVVFRDAAGSIIGGGYTYATIQANGQVGVEPSAYYPIPEVATFEVYAAYSVYELTD